MISHRFGALAVPFLILTACGDDDRMGMPDAGPADAGFDASFDAGFDAGPPEPSILFGECVTDEQCPGEGAFCRLPEEGWPNGFCTVPCVDRGPCDDGFRYNHCLDDLETESTEMFCEYRCLNGADCGRDNYTCVPCEGCTGAGYCIGFCTEDADCGGSAECNPWSSQCVAPGEVPTTGSETGGECAADEDCKSSDCILPYAPGFSGWVDGYCIGLCVLPSGYNTSTFYSGDELPQGTCAGDAVCWPGAGSYTARDPGLCLDGCTTDADCRQDDAYFCLKSIDLPGGGASSYNNGVCLPLDCGTTACPAGFTCRMIRTSGGTINRCERT